MVIGVTEAQINCVALVMKLWLFFASLINEFCDPIQLFLTLSDKAFKPGGVIEQTRLGLLIHEIDHLCEDRFRRGIKLGVLTRNPFIPISERFPFSAIG